jgi:DNA-directed RNA polymerase omega subunit
MNQFLAIESQRFVPNPFVLVHVAASRARQLKRGHEPQVELSSTTPPAMALEEIAKGAFGGDELVALLQAPPAAEPHPDQALPYGELELLDGLTRLAAEPPSRDGEVHEPDDSEWKGERK